MSSPITSRSDKRLFERCAILLVALVLTEPHTNKAQQDEIAKLIKALKRRLEVQ